MVECNLAKVDVAGSNPVSRSIFLATSPSGKAEACKAFITGSNPVVASNKTIKGLSGSDSPFFNSLMMFVYFQLFPN